MRPLSPRQLVASLFCVAAGLATFTDGSRAAAAEDSAVQDSLSFEARGDLPAALRAASSVADANPKRYFARLRVAYLELLQNNFAAAAKDYARAAELLPQSLEALLGRQQALIALGRYADAEPLGREILARDADNYLGSSRLAWTLFNLKRYPESAKIYARLLVLYPSDLEMATGLGYALLRSGRKSDAAEAFRSVLTASPAHPRAREGLAACR